MTPAKQDKELREILESAYGSAYQHGLNGNTPNLIKLAIDDIIQLITADRKRVELEARIDELKQLKFSVGDMVLVKQIDPTKYAYDVAIKLVQNRIARIEAQLSNTEEANQ